MENRIIQSIREALTELGILASAISLERPGELTNGDYATNIALLTAKSVGKTPHTLATEIVQTMKTPPEVAKVAVAGPGFINFYLSREYYTSSVAAINELGTQWGSNTHLAGQKIMVEYTDPNPFKELHIGHLVPNAIGEAIARILAFSGAEMKRVTFQGDIGMHVAKALWGMQQLGEPQSASDLGRAYAHGAQAFEENDEAKIAITKLNKEIYEGTYDTKAAALYERGRALSLASFDEMYTVLGSAFDHNFFESETAPIGKALVQKNIPAIFTESNGAVIFEGEKYGLHTRVFINAAGIPTYETKDIGLIQKKYEYFPYDRSITITATEQQSYFSVVLQAAALLYPQFVGKLEVVFNGMLLLSEGKMSSRTGNVIVARDLINQITELVLPRMKLELADKNRPKIAEEIAVAAMKYVILRSEVGTNMVFNFTTSVAFEGDTGPYLLYTHARTCSVLSNAMNAKIAASFETTPQNIFGIEHLLVRFPEVVAHSAATLSPHHLVTYATELSAAFNRLYAEEKIVDANDPFSPYKIALTNAVRHTLRNALTILGMSTPERM